MAHTHPLQQIAPGTRVQIRSEEWIVRQVDRTSTGTRVFGVVGLSPLVEGKEARFIEDIETAAGGEIAIVDPRLTKAVADPSAYYRNSRLMLESHIRATTPNSSAIHLGHRGAMDILPFQLEPTTLALQQPRQRLLIADAVGLGKTIECGILLSELIKRGRGRRILVVAVKSMLTQFQKELWSRFALPLTRLDSLGLQRVRRHIPTNHNPFHYYDKSIISIDTLKQDGEYRTHLENAWWDIIVIDEAHNVAERGSSRGGNSQRSRTAKLLASRSDSLILLSATPHDGKRESFASLMNMLNPTAIKNPKDYGPEDIDGLFIRRFKKDVKAQITGNFPERVVHTPRAEASAQEEAAYEHLTQLTFASLDQRQGGQKILFRTLLEKSLFSSPAACIATVEERIKRLGKKGTPEAEADRAELRSLLLTLQAITPQHFSKFQKLLRLLSSKTTESIGWNPQQPNDRLVIFTERIDTLTFLQTHLPPALKLKDKQVRVLHGSLSDLEQQEIVEAFGAADSPIRLLLASDVASEGINLHHQSHRLIHFDIPWSLLTFQQRNGRVDRYGQHEQPEIYYLLTESTHEKIRGDLRILELLIEKDEEVQRNIGDPSEFTGLHTVEEEEVAIAHAIESSKAPEEALTETFAASSASNDWFEAFLNAEPTPAAPSTSTETSPPLTTTAPSLYHSDFAWAQEGFETLRNQGIPMTVEADAQTQQLITTVPADLQRRLKKLPSEILASATGHFFRLFRAMMPPEQYTQDDLFLVGDGHQNLYGHHIVLSQLGIHIKGRGKKLKLNYRTPEETRRWATAILKGVEVNDLDGAADSAQGYRSLLSGPEPRFEPCVSFAEEIEKILAWANGIKAENPNHVACVAVWRSNTDRQVYAKELKAKGLDVHEITDKVHDHPDPGPVRLSTLYRVKGLEFDHVCLAGLRSVGKKAANAEQEASNKCLLHVAATRTKNSLLVLAARDQVNLG